MSDHPNCPECGSERTVKAGKESWNCEDCPLFFVPGEGVTRDFRPDFDRGTGLATDGGEDVSVDAQATFGTDGSLETPDSVETDLEDWGADCDNSERETQLDRPEAETFGVDDRPDYENDPDAGEQSDITPEKDENQRDLEGDAAEYPPEWLDSDADSWGPTMDRPIPDAEWQLIGAEKVDKRRLVGTGASPEDFHLAGGKWWGRSQNYNYHAADSEPRNAEEPRAEVFDRGEGVATDGGQETEPAAIDVDPENPPANETVRMVKGISGVMHTPEIIEGETSSSGKTIAVTVDRGGEKTYRLDSSKILAGGLETRKSTTFAIYTRERYQSQQSANKAPGPQAGCNQVADADDLPPATHRPPGEDERERKRQERREEAEKAREDRRESLGFADVENGARLIMDAHAGEYLVIKKVKSWGNVTGLELLGPDGNEHELTEATGDAKYWLKDEEDQRAIVSNLDAMDDVEAFEVIGKDVERLREYLRESR